MRRLLASLLILSALNTGSAFANRWEQRQPLFADRDRNERRPLLQRRQQEAPADAQAQRDAPRTGSPQSPQPAPLANAAPQPRPALQPADAGRRAQQQYGGRVLSVSPGDNGYHVRLLRDGEVSNVTVPN